MLIDQRSGVQVISQKMMYIRFKGFRKLRLKLKLKFDCFVRSLHFLGRGEGHSRKLAFLVFTYSK